VTAAVVARVLAVRVVNDVGVLDVVEAVLHDATLGVVSRLAVHVRGASSLPLRVLATRVMLTHVSVSERVTGAATLPVGVRSTSDAVDPLTPVRRRSSGRGSPAAGELVTAQPALEEVTATQRGLPGERGPVDSEVRH